VDFQQKFGHEVLLKGSRLSVFNNFWFYSSNYSSRLNHEAPEHKFSPLDVVGCFKALKVSFDRRLC